jgi:hypothetical protein
MDAAVLIQIIESTDMSNSDRNVNNGSAAAALGLAVAVEDIENIGNDTNSNNSSSADTSHSYNQDNDTSHDNDTLNVALSETDIEDSYNQDNDNVTTTVNTSISDNDTFTKTVNLSDNDTITKTLNLSDNDVKDSHNQDNDSLNVNLAFSDDDVTDSYNQDNDTNVSNSHNTAVADIDTTVDVAITDAFKSITDSYDQDNEWLDLDGLNFDVMSVIGEGVLAGSGNDVMFNLAQVSELSDADSLSSPTVTNDADFDVSQFGKGGDAFGGEDFDERGTGTASADGVAQLEAFTQNIVMGANIQYNNVDVSIVGGDSSVNDSGDIS